MIHCDHLEKIFKVHQKEPGLKGSLRGLFHRQWVEKPALKGVSLKVDAGEIVGLIGANGAGKTTLVKICAGIIQPTAGTARVLGHEPFARSNDLRRQMSLIMGQKQQLWWDLPAADGFLLLREIYLIPKTVFQNRLSFLAETLGVTTLLTTPVRKLSLGERMKMELIAALLHEPKVVFLDEPTIGLDLTAQKAIRQFLISYQQSNRPAMLLTSHYMEDIEKLCERIVIMREGEIVYDGGLKQVVQKFAHSKIITMHLGTPLSKSLRVHDDLAVHLPTAPKGQATILSVTDEMLKVQVKKTRVADMSALMLREFPVQDLSIEAQDISAIIESIMRGGDHDGVG